MGTLLGSGCPKASGRNGTSCPRAKRVGNDCIPHPSPVTNYFSQKRQKSPHLIQADCCCLRHLSGVIYLCCYFGRALLLALLAPRRMRSNVPSASKVIGCAAALLLCAVIVRADGPP